MFRHKELGHPLIIVNHAINLSVAQMNTALEMRQSLLACYVSLTQFILLFTQDHSYVKLCEGVSLSLSLCLSRSHSNSPSLSHTHTHTHTLSNGAPSTHSRAGEHAHTLLMRKTHRVNICGQTISAKGRFIIITMFVSIENVSHCIFCTTVELLATYTSDCCSASLSRD